MKRILSIIGVVELLVLPSRAVPQTSTDRATVETSPTFFFEALSYASDQLDKSRIDLYIQVPHQELRFVKQGDNYVARYDITLGVYDHNQRLLQERTWGVDVRVTDFAATTSNRIYSLTQRMLELEPGNYNFTVQVQDQDSRKTSRIRRAMLVTDFSKDSLSLSDIMLVSRLSVSGDTKKIVPNISGNVSELGDGFFLFFEIYRESPADSVDLTLKIRNSKKEEVYGQSHVEDVSSSTTQSFLKVENLNLPVGTYFVTIEAQPRDKSAVLPGFSATTSRTFNVRWTDVPSTVGDIDKAIEQLRYVARISEMDYMKEPKDAEEKKKRFLEFWAKRDPDPQTPRNELMEEYYQRVEHANKTFSHYMEGWRTDMGMVFIRFGQPDNVERRPFEINAKPFEVWYYYQLNREFIFVDETGFGDYRLRYPSTDLFGRIRD
jgi:GWxTD domain-containing protein